MRRFLHTFIINLFSCDCDQTIHTSFFCFVWRKSSSNILCGIWDTTTESVSVIGWLNDWMTDYDIHIINREFWMSSTTDKEAIYRWSNTHFFFTACYLLLWLLFRSLRFVYLFHWTTTKIITITNACYARDDKQTQRNAFLIRGLSDKFLKWEISFNTNEKFDILQTSSANSVKKICHTIFA